MALHLDRRSAQASPLMVVTLSHTGSLHREELFSALEAAAILRATERPSVCFYCRQQPPNLGQSPAYFRFPFIALSLLLVMNLGGTRPG